MKRAEILFCVQARLIKDLGAVIKKARKDYKGKLKNAWVFDRLEKAINRMKPAGVCALEYGRKELEVELNRAADEGLAPVQAHVPEIETKHVRRLIKVLGGLFDSLSRRARAELKCFEAKAAEYKTPQALVAGEFEKARAFKSKKEHERWVAKVSKDFGEILDYAGKLGDSLAAKSGFAWSLKLMAAQAYLRSSFDMNLELEELNMDLKVARNAILKGFQDYETKLMRGRYS